MAGSCRFPDRSRGLADNAEQGLGIQAKLGHSSHGGGRSDNCSDMSSALLPASSRAPGRWIDHWLETVQDIEALRAAHPMMDAVIEEVDGRMIRVGDSWLADFASCNYLGFDLDPEIIECDPRLPRELGHPPELVAAARQPGPLRADRGAADRAARLRGHARAADDHPHPHVGDPRARGLRDDLPRRPRPQDDLRRLPGRPRSRGAAVRRFRFEDPDHLDELLARRARPRAAGVHGRRQQHDRQRRPTCARSPRSRAATARCCTSTTPTASA